MLILTFFGVGEGQPSASPTVVWGRWGKADPLSTCWIQTHHYHQLWQAEFDIFVIHVILSNLISWLTLTACFSITFFRCTGPPRVQIRCIPTHTQVLVCDYNTCSQTHCASLISLFLMVLHLLNHWVIKPVPRMHEVAVSRSCVATHGQITCAILEKEEFLLPSLVSSMFGIK